MAEGDQLNVKSPGGPQSCREGADSLDGQAADWLVDRLAYTGCVKYLEAMGMQIFCVF